MRATEFIVETAMMGKIADSGKIIRILKKAHTVPFSDEKNWLLVDTDPGKGNSGLGIKWIPADTRFEWVRPYRDTVEQGVAEGFLNEIYKMPPTKDSSQGMTTWAYNDAVEKKSPVLYRDSNVIIFKANEDLLRYIILQDGNPVLYIGLSKFLDGYKSGTVATEAAGRGKGLAQKAYLNVSDILGVPIYSDTTQTDASRLGIWDKLIQQYPERIVGYDQKTNKNLPLSMTDKGPVVNQNQPIYVDRNKKDTTKPIAPNQRYRTRVLKLLPIKQGVAEGTKLVADGSIINVYHNGPHIGNIFVSNTKDTPYKAYSKHWDMSRLFKSKKAAADWLAQTHQTAIKEEQTGMAEEAPPGARAERMVKHIKKNYAKDGKLTPKERSIAYATAWKAHNRSVTENFADGRNPQDKGDSQRHGIPKGATMAELEKAAKASGRKGQLARWQLNMRRGRARARKK